MKKLLGFILVLLLSCTVLSFSEGKQEGEEAAGKPSMELRYAHSNVPTYFYHTAGKAFAQRLSGLTDGRLNVKLYAQGQLGGERDVTEGLQLGTIDFQASSIGVTGTFIPAIRVLNLPFLFNGPKHFMKVINGPVGEELLAKAREQGEKVDLKVLSIAAPSFRVPMNDIRPISSPADFQGVKMRTMEVQTHMKAYSALGADPTPLPFGELYTALQTDVVDGNENGPMALFGNKFYEVQKYVTLLPVVSNGGIFLMSKATWDKLPAEDQDAVMEATDIWTETMNQDALELGGYAIDKMKGAGIEVNQVRNVAAFKQSVQPVYDWFYDSLPEDLQGWAEDMVQKIREAGEGVEEGDWYAAAEE